MKGVSFFIITVGTVPAAAFAAVSTLQVELFGKYLVTLLIIIKVLLLFDVGIGHKLNIFSKKITFV